MRKRGCARAGRRGGGSGVGCFVCSARVQRSDCGVRGGRSGGGLCGEMRNCRLVRGGMRGRRTLRRDVRGHGMWRLRDAGGCWRRDMGELRALRQGDLRDAGRGALRAAGRGRRDGLQRSAARRARAAREGETVGGRGWRAALRLTQRHACGRVAGAGEMPGCRRASPRAARCASGRDGMESCLQVRAARGALSGG